MPPYVQPPVVKADQRESEHSPQPRNVSGVQIRVLLCGGTIRLRRAEMKELSGSYLAHPV